MTKLVEKMKDRYVNQERKLVEQCKECGWYVLPTQNENGYGIILTPTDNCQVKGSVANFRLEPDGRLGLKLLVKKDRNQIEEFYAAHEKEIQLMKALKMIKDRVAKYVSEPIHGIEFLNGIENFTAIQWKGTLESFNEIYNAFGHDATFLFNTCINKEKVVEARLQVELSNGSLLEVEKNDFISITECGRILIWAEEEFLKEYNDDNFVDHLNAMADNVNKHNINVRVNDCCDLDFTNKDDSINRSTSLNFWTEIVYNPGDYSKWMDYVSIIDKKGTVIRIYRKDLNRILGVINGWHANKGC